jgi:phosphoribosylamine--glycine ligase
MRVLVIGSGGREHALIWKIKQSPYIEEIYCAPGNGGIESLAHCVDIEVDDFKSLIQFAERNGIDLTVVGPELPLTLGIVDQFQKAGLPIFGPTQKAAELEGSKVFAKEFMERHKIPTATYKSFKSAKEAVRYIHTVEPPFVVKADGLAAGKGVIICQSHSEGFDAVEKIMKKKAFGKSGGRIVIEEFLQGEEVSVLAITDGEHYVLLPPAQDHKAAYEGDSGPNTGGMGAYAPAPVLSDKDLKFVEKNVIKPVIKGMKSEDRLYKGVLYAGLILTQDGPKVLEFNCRFGDPEIQAILPLLKTDIVDLMIESTEGRLKNNPPQFEDKAAVCVVLASGGYPGSYAKGIEIQGLKSVPKDVLVFHAGTRKKGSQVVTSGGRVLGVTAMSDDIKKAIDKVYQAVSQITFDRAFYRGDIAHRAIERL